MVTKDSAREARASLLFSVGRIEGPPSVLAGDAIEVEVEHTDRPTDAADGQGREGASIVLNGHNVTFVRGLMMARGGGLPAYR